MGEAREAHPDAPPVTPSLGPKEELQILLAEYAATRQEIFSRYTALVQSIIFGVSAFLALVTYMSVNSFWIGVFPLIIDLAVLWYSLTIIDFDTRAAAAHLEKLEGRINSLLGKTLLTWETQNGLRTKPMRERLKKRLGDNVQSLIGFERSLVEKGAPYAQELLSQFQRLIRFPHR